MIVITAANGHLGRAVAAELHARKASSRVRLAARDPDKLHAPRDQGFEVARADYDDAASLDVALAGATTLLLISSNGTNPDRIRQHKTAIDAAKRAGVQRIVYTSFTNPSLESKFVWAHPHAETESYLKQSGIAWTILRNNQYFTNIDPMLDQAALKGAFVIPGATGQVAYVGHEDLGAATAAALLQGGHAGKTYELTGSEAFGGACVATLLGETLGRPIASVDASYEDFAAYFRSLNLPEFLIEGMLTSYAAAEAGEHASISRDIERLTGRPAKSLRDYIANKYSRGS